MIIKSKRIRARGPALKRAFAHICDGDDNDEVILLRGNPADLVDARDDAIRFARQYCVRHWIISPAQDVTDEQLDELIERLAFEFEFDAKRIVLWAHEKERASKGEGDLSEGAAQGQRSPRHFHLLAPEVDPLSGRVMPSSHDWDRQSKLARICEVRWGHGIVPAPRMNSLIAALDREGDHVTAEALRGVQAPDHPASFNETDHQRTKRIGVDLPRVRELVAQALTSATSREDFDSRLARVGLRLGFGDKKDTLIVETADGTFVGALARLVRLRKEALAERLSFNAAAAPAVSKHPSDDLRRGSPARAAIGAGHQARPGDGQSERGRSDRYDHRTALTDGDGDRSDSRQAGSLGSAPGRRDGDERDQKLRTRLRLAAGGLRQTEALLDLLGAARRNTLPPLERVISDLDGLVEQETVALRVAQLAEPASFLAARRKVEHAAALVRSLEEKANGLSESIAHHPSQSIWARLISTANGPDRRSLEIRLDRLREKIATAGAALSTARAALQTEERKFRMAQVRYQAALPDRRERATRQIATARLARSMAEKSPRCARWGAVRLFAVAGTLQTARARMHRMDETLDENWEPSFDLWGIPRLPPPKIF
ncbi:hypothetical protein JQ557_05820 [Bradyrhizobium sp. U87765 SZCCT0131]|uniref:hypothetical protein n=1 Tax=unclassified Bradyrhizobium TaxID=2631580 RepID=UPI001BA8004F|nr:MULTISPECIES: hypothetical protein [unclassified Bradyrhizobium]MBR1217494.1 hypothetical protein [Bradyrhizobium sp. U87765 SZCCT0131]MBR1264908.1 hypothetical protein [Bradyrhizobium sp. U87765 SZCCT0134]MBR1304890.1 hypothetical protein [Bradyrhizobium sp. U87765 SZCCT0110]MBR1320677.1 hypothetical protein [Bradyrhizobium sp. U87765 SZCCT0109]MBR1349097.1 hypothetical protein [Bradyrhizobium sp. U87765 SZCCT0048]